MPQTEDKVETLLELIKRIALEYGEKIKETSSEVGGKIKDTALDAGEKVKETAIDAGEGLLDAGKAITPKPVQDFIGDPEFQERLKTTANNLWIPTLAATLGSGALGGTFSALEPTRRGESKGDRRKRIIRNSLLSGALGGGTIAGLGLTSAALGPKKESDSSRPPPREGVVGALDATWDTTVANPITAAGGATALTAHKLHDMRYRAPKAKAQLAELGKNFKGTGAQQALEMLSPNPVNATRNINFMRQKENLDSLYEALIYDPAHRLPTVDPAARARDAANYIYDAGAPKSWTAPILNLNSEGDPTKVFKTVGSSGKLAREGLLRRSLRGGRIKGTRNPYGIAATTAAGLVGGNYIENRLRRDDVSGGGLFGLNFGPFKEWTSKSFKDNSSPEELMSKYYGFVGPT